MPKLGTLLIKQALGAPRYRFQYFCLNSLEALVTRLAAMTIPEIAAIPSLDPARAPVLLGGSIVAREALGATGMESVAVSENDLLVGMALAAAT